MHQAARFALLVGVSAGSIALPAHGQTVTPSSGVWATSTSGSTVTTSTITLTTPPPFAFSFSQPTSSGSYPATVKPA